MTAAIPAAAQADPADLQPVRLAGRAPRLLVVDNYDSFTYNLVQYLGQLGSELTVLRNDAFTPADVVSLDPDGIVISPGPCTPQEAGQTVPLIRELAGRIPMLGVCLGHQAIGAAFGARVERASQLMHGKTSDISHDARELFSGLPSPLTVTRYHSLVLRGLPPELQVTATVSEGGEEVIMGIRHTQLPLWGVQFHPESILSQGGHRLLRNFLLQLAEAG